VVCNTRLSTVGVTEIFLSLFSRVWNALYRSMSLPPLHLLFSQSPGTCFSKCSSRYVKRSTSMQRQRSDAVTSDTLIVHFYRATLCVSAVFAVARCLSVRPSVTLVNCIQTDEDSVKLLCWPGSPSPQFFDPMRRYPIPRGTPSAGAQNTRCGKILRFLTEIAVYLRNGTR